MNESVVTAALAVVCMPMSFAIGLESARTYLRRLVFSVPANFPIRLVGDCIAIVAVFASISDAAHFAKIAALHVIEYIYVIDFDTTFACVVGTCSVGPIETIPA